MQYTCITLPIGVRITQSHGTHAMIHTLIKLYTSLLVMQLSLINRRSTGGERSAMLTGGGHRLVGSRVQFSGVGRRSARGRGRGWASRGAGSALVGVASPERAPALMRELSVPSQQSASPTHEKSIAVKKVYRFTNHVLRMCMIYSLHENFHFCQALCIAEKFGFSSYLLYAIFNTGQKIVQ